jgi:hypothetical protein
MYKEQMDELIDKLVTECDAEFNYVSYIENWQAKFEIELRRKVGEISILNCEVRENMKFLVQLSEKDFNSNSSRSTFICLRRYSRKNQRMDHMNVQLSV